MEKGLSRGFITYEELQKSLGKRNANVESLEKSVLHIFDQAICFVKKKSDFKVKKLESETSKQPKNQDRSDDPIRMYLREMGGVELLSREGEIAIAKRIESGKYVMVSSLSESPVTAKKIFEWEERLINNEMLVRDIIDLDTNFLDDDKLKKSIKEKKEKEEDIYTEFVSIDYVSEDPKRSLYLLHYNPHWRSEYELTTSNSGFQRHMIPVSELKVVNDVVYTPKKPKFSTASVRSASTDIFNLSLIHI